MLYLKADSFSWYRMGERSVGQMKTVKVLLRAFSGAGKTGLINQVLAECGVKVCGLRTARHFEQGRHCGYNLSVLSTGEQLEMARGEPRVPGMRPAPGFFDEQVRPRLIREAQADGVLLVDEVGRFEKHDALYLDALWMLWRSERPMILVLKKEPLPFNEAIWNGSENALKIDLDMESRAWAAQGLAAVLGAGEKEQPFECLQWETDSFNEALSGVRCLRAWQQAHLGTGAAFVRSQCAQVRALAADAGLIPVKEEWPGPLIRTHARVTGLTGAAWMPCMDRE